jgi:beta-lactamase regulating signal transducer with metallopeptidase domain
MPDGLWLVLILIAFVVIYAVVRIREYMRVSNEQWKNVDKSKLREWEDEDD